MATKLQRVAFTFDVLSLALEEIKEEATLLCVAEPCVTNCKSTGHYKSQARRYV